MLYSIIKFYIRITLSLFYKKITILGVNNIPKNAPVLFVANHQNAMMDPIIVATSIKKPMYFLARASAFKNSIAAKFLRAIHAIAIYRVRDGVDSKALNEAVFDECLSLFNKNKRMLIFPEGSHSVKRQVRSLRAGFTRITIDYLKANPSKEFFIVPIGLNYDNTINYAKSVHVIYGKAINTRTLFNEQDIDKTKNLLITEVHKALKQVTVHIDDDNYESKHESLSEEDFLHPIKTNQKLKSFKPKVILLKNSKKNIFHYLMLLNSIFPMLIWRWLEPKIEAKEFISTAKYSLGITIFPVFYFIQSRIILLNFGIYFAYTYLICSILLVFIATKTTK